MTVLTNKSNHHIIKDDLGAPVAVIVPYTEYTTLFADDDDVLIPHEVVKFYIKHNSLVRAWREYLGVTQAEMAKRMKITQPSYGQMERSRNPRPETLKKIAKALKIDYAQLDMTEIWQKDI